MRRRDDDVQARVVPRERTAAREGVEQVERLALLAVALTGIQNVLPTLAEDLVRP